MFKILNVHLKSCSHGYITNTQSKFKSKAGLKQLFACCHPTLGLRVGS